MKHTPLWHYVIGVIIVLAVTNGIAWRVAGVARLEFVGCFSLGFLAGMLGMYIAVHLYNWK